MAFPDKEAQELLASCHRRCCICHRFCGFKMELDHILPKGDGGPDSIENAIAVCFECHAEIHAYNDKHPRGRKYRPEELKRHKAQWLDICKSSAQFLASIPPRTDVGPLQALIDELEFNQSVAESADEVAQVKTSAYFAVAQFQRCVSEGILSLLEPSLKAAVIKSYVVMERANTQVDAIPTARSGQPHALAVNDARDRLREALPLIRETLTSLSKALSQEG
jgi:HNH endonuclease